MVTAPFLIAVPLAAAFLTPLLGLISRRFARWLPVLALAVNLVTAWRILGPTLAAGSPTAVLIGGWRIPWGINLQVGALGVGLAALIALISLLVAVYALTYIRIEAEPRYHMLFLLLVTGATGIVLTGDIFNLFVFLEILCLSAYGLTATLGDKNGTEAAFKYLVQGSVGSSLVLIAIALIYGLFGTLNMAHIASLAPSANHHTLVLIALLFVTGIGVEAAVFPLNAWLPDAHSSAPSSISAVLSGFVIEMALVVMLKVLYSVLGLPTLAPVLGVLGVLTLLVGEFVAFRQTNIKRVLAYSSVGQLGLILFAFSLHTPEGIAAGLLQLGNHALAKSILFLAAGYMIARTGAYDYRSYSKLAQKMPLACGAFTIGALALIGVPPLFGFFSKFRIITAAANAGGAGELTAILWILGGTVVEAAYFLRIIQVLYFGAPESETAPAPAAAEAPPLPVLAMAVLVLLLLIGLVYLPFVTSTAHTAAVEMIQPLTSLASLK